MRILGVVAKAKDPLNVMLMHFDTDFSDSSIYNRAFTASAGAPTIDSGQSVFGGVSASFSGADELTTPNNANYDITSGSFTIDFWLKPNLGTLAFNALQGIFAKGQTLFFGSDYSYYGYIGRNAAGTGGYFRFHFFIYVLGQAATNLQANLDFAIWNHIAIVRNGSLFTLYINGVSSATFNAAQALQTSAQPFYLAHRVISTTDFTTVATKYSGWLDEFRMRKDAAWAANFTPPTTPHRA